MHARSPRYTVCVQYFVYNNHRSLVLTRPVSTESTRMADDLNLDLSFEVKDELDETENISSSSDEDEGDLGDVAEDELEIEPMPVPPAACFRCT